MVAGWNPFFFKKKLRFHILHFPIQPDFSQNQPAAITLNTSLPGHWHRDRDCDRNRELDYTARYPPCGLGNSAPIHQICPRPDTRYHITTS